MNRDQVIEHLAAVLAGLQVPVSMSMPLGTADQSLRALMTDAGVGWKSTEEFETYLRRVLP